MQKGIEGEKMEEEKVDAVDDPTTSPVDGESVCGIGNGANSTEPLLGVVGIVPTTMAATAAAAAAVGVGVGAAAALAATSGTGSDPNDRPSLPSHLKSDKSPLGRVPKLERKHSSGDLHSRLKTRKMLGVGETENGDIHRSKISQVLGHNEHLYLKLPKGYWNWQAFLAGLLATQAGLILILPESSGQLGLIGVEVPGSAVPSQYYAVTMLALSYLLWKFLNLKDKMVTRATLVSILIHFSALCCVDLVHALKSGLWSTLVDVKGLTMMGLRGLTLAISFFYLSRMGTATSGLRKSPSHKDVSMDTGGTNNSRGRE